MAQRLALLVEKHPDLVKVIEAWKTLPEAVRAGITAMVEASANDEGGE